MRLRTAVPLLVFSCLSPFAVSQANYDLLLRGGRVIDAKNGINAVRDVAIQASTDNPDAGDLTKRYPKAQARDFDGDPARVTEADALIAYLQLPGPPTDVPHADDHTNIRNPPRP